MIFPEPRGATRGWSPKYHRRLCSGIVWIILLLLSGCAGTVPVPPKPQPPRPVKPLARIGYSIQVGAFSKVDNAVRLTESLEERGVDAYYFRHKTGLYKVRFGDFPSRETARSEADRLVVDGTIDAYYIVSPDDYAVAGTRIHGGQDLRGYIVSTAKSFVGIPYRWGGMSPDRGFDCSGLTMAVYQLNGLKLPRSSREQYRAGSPVGRNELVRGDLVFFATAGGRNVSHVGVYTGNNRFIHAPGKGKTIRSDSLSTPYYRNRFVGARSYL